MAKHHVSKKARPSSAKGLTLALMALAVLLSYPLGVAVVFICSPAPSLNKWQRLQYSLSWPLIAFTDLMDRAKEHLPERAA